ncbi:hypothetical protein GE300_20140 [Rhodobacteraceae bacterium 2CG4]|uniref:Uncharacterized protein n=1 Tax=Halovulum marinum TaxID=2662447 RepID=A0A6L5Z5M5_9RHOB|nr:hypothetical protein [Halovulum marinum]MSU91886.1 hypothetical protein [Halovulum marinum]
MGLPDAALKGLAGALAEDLGGTTAPGARADDILREKEKFLAKVREYAAFSREARLEAEVARLRGNLKTIAGLCKRPIDADQALLNRKLGEIYDTVDLLPDLDLETDLAWMKANGHSPETPSA